MKRNILINSVKGFTLVELVITLVILSIGATTIIALTSNIYNYRQFKRNAGVNTGLAQECAELILNRSRESYSNIATTNCNGINVSGYGAPTIFALTTGSSSTGGSADWTSTDWDACPYSTGSDCTLLKISNGQLKPISLMLVNH